MNKIVTTKVNEMEVDGKRVVIHRDGSVTEQRNNDLPIVLLPLKETALRKAKSSDKKQKGK